MLQNKYIWLSEFNGTWNIIHDSDNPFELVWSNGKYSLSYTNNIFGKFGQGWVVRMIPPQKNDNYSNHYYNYIPGEFFAIKTNGAPWSDDREIIYSKILKNINPEELNIIIEEKGGIILNDKFDNNILNYNGLYNFSTIIKIAQMSNSDNINLTCSSDDLPKGLKIINVIKALSQSYNEYDFDFDTLKDGIYLAGKFDEDISGSFKLNLSYNDQHGFNMSKNLIINYDLISPLTFQSLQNQDKVKIQLINNNEIDFENIQCFYLKYNNNKLNYDQEVNWERYNDTVIQLNNNENVAFWINISKEINYNFKTSGGKCNVLGDILSLYNYQESYYNFYSCFKDCENIINADKLLLPTTNLSESCYESMFEGCIQLISTPILPSMNLNVSCYKRMFKGCGSLIKAPILPATELVESCYEEMFIDCSNLKQIEVGFVDWGNNSEYTLNWLKNVYEEGHFLKYDELEIVLDQSHIPQEWIVNDMQKTITIHALEENTSVKFSCDNDQYIYYKTNYNDWNKYINNQNIILKNINDFICFKSEYEENSLTNPYFSISGKVSLSGQLQSLMNFSNKFNITRTNYNNIMFSNCTALVDASKLKMSATILGVGSYEYMFKNCINLIYAPLQLPALQLKSNCYCEMFYNCTSLQYAPEILATIVDWNSCYQMFYNCNNLVKVQKEFYSIKLAYSCYSYMFQNCTSLTQAPSLPATTLAESCYEGMFSGCSSLKQAPELFAKEFESSCYSYMFQNCISLNKIRVHFDVWNNYSFFNWVYGVSNQGVFIKPRQLQQIIGSSNIPYGWVAENDISNKLQIPLTLKSMKDNSSVRIIKNYQLTQDTFSDIELYRSYDEGKTYKKVTYKVNQNSLWIDSLKRGDTISFWMKDNDAFINNKNNFYQFQLKGKFEVSGNILSLNNFSQTMGNCNFNRLFLNCNVLSESENLYLPIPKTDFCYESMFEGCTALNNHPIIESQQSCQLTQGCYKSMFKSCINLSSMPQLLAKNLSESCYESMFEECSSLYSVSNLQSEQLKNNCYKRMFYGCENITKFPKLSALKLINGCYEEMFTNCINLKQMQVGFIDWDNNCTYNWVDNVSKSGLFIKPINLSDIFGKNNIPYGWKVENIISAEIMVQSPIELIANQCQEIQAIQLLAWSSDNSPVFFRLINKLPQGLILSQEGLISGTPLESGSGTTQIQVSCKGAVNNKIILNWNIQPLKNDIFVNGFENQIEIKSTFILKGLNGSIEIQT